MSAHAHLAKLAAVLTIVVSSACHAESHPAPDRSAKDHPAMSTTLAVADVMGAWSVESSGARTKCVLSLSNLGRSVNRQALAENCIGTPFEAARSWRLIGATFEVLDASDRPIARFRQTDVDTFEAIDVSSAGERVRLRRAAAM